MGKKACTGTRWRAGTASEQTSEQKHCCFRGCQSNSSCTQTCKFCAPSSSARCCCRLQVLSKSWRRGIFQLNWNIYAYTCMLPIQAHRNVKQSNPHIQRLNQHLKLTHNRSNFRMTCASNTPLVPGTPGAPAQRSPILNQLRSSYKAEDTVHVCLCAVCCHSTKQNLFTD